jgi:tetratricopeptide (TPR) repeat protein
MLHNTPEYRQQLAQEGRHAEALQAFRDALETKPDDPTLLFNAGLSAYLSGQFAPATAYWTRLKKLTPQDLQVRAKLVQAYEALGNSTARNAERAELFALRNRIKVDRSRPTQYCRDLFRVGEWDVQAGENFDFAGDWAVRYTFYIFQRGEPKPAYVLSLGSYAMTNQLMHERGELQPGERAFHLDEYHPDGRHHTRAFFKNEPPYEAVKTIVQRLLSETQAGV